MAYDAGTFFDLSPGDISVLVGSNTLAPGIGDLVEVAAVFRHPDHIGTEFDHDIALLKLVRMPQAAYATSSLPDVEFGNLPDQPDGGLNPGCCHKTTKSALCPRPLCLRTG